jgi:peptide chain release factor 2
MRELETLQKELDEVVQRLGLADLEKEQQDLTAKSQTADFWQDAAKAQEIMKQLSRHEARIKPWHDLQKRTQDLLELSAMNDQTLEGEISTQYNQLQKTFSSLKKELMFSGKYDDHDVILQIHAGAGGTDAQDWAQMLMRMYVRWAEAHNYKVNTIEQSVGEEAGIKSVTLEIEGSFLYGKLKGEHGVHRLVRLSPFNSDNLRQTSFAKVEILPKIATPEDVIIDEKEIKVDVYRSGGHGGQSVNTTDSAVRVTHLATGITVAIQNERSQLQNKETAMTILRSRLAQMQLEQHKEKIGELKGPNQSAEWGSQIRSYVLHPYKQVKDLRTKHESSDPDKVLNGDLDDFINAYLEATLQ